jgi:hypothetical protein
MEAEVEATLILTLHKCYNETYFQKYDRECEKVMVRFGVDSKWGKITDIALLAFLKTCYVIEFQKVNEFIVNFLPSLFEFVRSELKSAPIKGWYDI